MQANWLACIFQNFFSNIKDFNHFIKVSRKRSVDMDIGVLRVEEADMEKGAFVLTVSEDLDCSGIARDGYENLHL